MRAEEARAIAEVAKAESAEQLRLANEGHARIWAEQLGALAAHIEETAQGNMKGLLEYIAASAGQGHLSGSNTFRVNVPEGVSDQEGRDFLMEVHYAIGERTVSILKDLGYETSATEGVIADTREKRRPTAKWLHLRVSF